MYTMFKNYFTYLQVIPLYIEDYRIPHQQPQVSVHFDNIESDISVDTQLVF